MKALMKTTKSVKPAEVTKKWHLIDADGLVVGRLATIIANILRGKHKPASPARTASTTRRDQRRQGQIHRPQARAETYYKHTGYPAPEGNHRGKVSTAGFQSACRKAVERMIPRGPLGRQQMRSLHLYNSSEHPHAGQDPQILDVASMSRKNKVGA